MSQVRLAEVRSPLAGSREAWVTYQGPTLYRVSHLILATTLRVPGHTKNRLVLMIAWLVTKSRTHESKEWTPEPMDVSIRGTRVVRREGTGGA